MKELVKVNLGFFPTPLHKLAQLSKRLGSASIYIKRDDLTGLAFGGNKTRKLEYLIGDALYQNCDCVITGGAMQSNHCRQTAAAAAMTGLKCHLVLGGEEPDYASGNFMLDKLFGAQIHWSGEFRKGEKIPELYNQLKHEGKKPYIIPYGGSNAVGAFGFAKAVQELKIQLAEMKVEINKIIFSSSSSGTHAGLNVGKKIFQLNSDLIGIQIDKVEATDTPLLHQVVDLSNETCNLIGEDQSFTKEEIILRKDFMDTEYGVVSDRERNAIKLLAETEGILLDPVYTGRAFGALIEMIEKGEFRKNENILFWHTGGTPTIFSYSQDLVR